jgi:glycerol-3-phosphate dehydrogenase (NAD(P)+)
MKFGILGSGSWGTALAKILTDNNHHIAWWVRNESSVEAFISRHHNPHYLSMVHFDVARILFSTDAEKVINESDVIIVAIPSAYAVNTFMNLDKGIFKNKKIVSAIKGILPEQNLLLNDYLKDQFKVELKDYFAVLGPCHAEEIAAEKLSYLTFTGMDEAVTKQIASCFCNNYLNTVLNRDIFGVQYAAVLKNIYAVGAGIAHGLDYGDNFLSVLIANSADEMAGFLRKAGIINAEVGYIEHFKSDKDVPARHNYAASVYLGDLLVTCYSLFSRNRTFGNMIGKGYSVKSAQMEMNMVAEGYNASRCMHLLNQKIGAEMPLAETIYDILWEQLPADRGFKSIESLLI